MPRAHWAHIVAHPARSLPVLLLLLALAVALFGAGRATQLTVAAASSPVRPGAVQAYGKLPLSFELNQGQADSAVRFLARGQGYNLFLTPTDAVLTLRNAEAASEGAPVKEATLRMGLVGAGAAPHMVGLDQLPGRAHYLLGNDPSLWRKGIPTFRRVRYQEVYPGIDLEYHGDQGRLEYDFVVAPGADPSVIALSHEGVDGVRLEADGSLALTLPDGAVRLHKPVSYQDTLFGRRIVPSAFVLGSDGHVRFTLGAYDRALPLVIDPILTYSTYLGGVAVDAAYDVALDDSGNAYVVGITDSVNFPPSPHDPSSLQTSKQSGLDVFITKLSADGATQLYSTYLGGSGDDQAFAVAVDGDGNAWLTGITWSSNFPLQNAFDSTLGPNIMPWYDAFVAGIDSAGSSLVYGTYFGGEDTDNGQAIGLRTVGATLHVYVGGLTYSPDFPTKNAYQGSKAGGYDGFLSVLVPSQPPAAQLLYSTYLGGSASDPGGSFGAETIAGLAIGTGGLATVAGVATSADFPTKNALYPAKAGLQDAFVARLDPSATGAASLVFSTFLGGASTDGADDVVLDASGNIYVTGATLSSNFPTTTGAVQEASGGNWDAFITKLSASGSSVVYSTYLGGTDEDQGHDIAVDSAGAAYVVGHAKSVDFPVEAAAQGARGGGFDAFAAMLRPSGASLGYSTYLGGSDNDFGWANALLPDGTAVIVGWTHSTNFPLESSLQASKSGDADAFIAKIGPAEEEVVVLPAPQGLQCTPGNGQAHLAWDPVTGATGYVIYMAALPSPWLAWNESLPGAMRHDGVSEASFDHMDLTNGATYYFAVAALKDGVEGEMSDQVSCAPAAPVAPDRTLTLSSGGQGNGVVTVQKPGGSDTSTCSPTCAPGSFPYAEGTQLTLTAQAAQGYTFAGWGGACDGTAPCTLTMSNNKTVIANFNPPAPLPPAPPAPATPVPGVPFLGLGILAGAFLLTQVLLRRRGSLHRP